MILTPKNDNLTPNKRVVNILVQIPWRQVQVEHQSVSTMKKDQYFAFGSNIIEMGSNVTFD